MGKDMERRAINLNLLTIHFPVTAIVSILHRLSGLLVFFLIPVVLWVLQESLGSEAGFIKFQTWISMPLIQIGLWIFVAGLSFHLLAGLRHLLMDTGVGDSKSAARFTAWCVLFLSACLFLGLGAWLIWK